MKILMCLRLLHSRQTNHKKYWCSLLAWGTSCVTRDTLFLPTCLAS